LFCALIYGAVSLECAGVISVPRWMVFLGDASYSIYLAHTTLQQFLKTLLVWCGFSLAAHPQLFMVSLALGSIGLSLVVYILVEKPLLKWFQSRGPGRIDLSRAKKCG
ncbi:MAG TPA: hypothetical protein VK815_01975, partial [Candidatus Acidoferrales bacterium]|jgi:exopolysaccharide production protein ExoZ|nr:hypothetical protein [Candidatus Acidoferrales bacterium]